MQITEEDYNALVNKIKEQKEDIGDCLGIYLSFLTLLNNLGLDQAKELSSMSVAEKGLFFIKLTKKMSQISNDINNLFGAGAPMSKAANRLLEKYSQELKLAYEAG